MSGRMIVLYKQPDVIPVGVVETWRRIFDKIVLRFTGTEATMVCQDDQLRAILKAEINSAVLSVQAIWDENSTTKDWVFFIIDANNMFNEINRVRMLRTVRHIWLSRAFFVFNCYFHW